MYGTEVTKQTKQIFKKQYTHILPYSIFITSVMSTIWLNLFIVQTQKKENQLGTYQHWLLFAATNNAATSFLM